MNEPCTKPESVEPPTMTPNGVTVPTQIKCPKLRAKLAALAEQGCLTYEWDGSVLATSGTTLEFVGVAADGTKVNLGTVYTYLPKVQCKDEASLLNYLTACPGPESW